MFCTFLHVDIGLAFLRLSDVVDHGNKIQSAAKNQMGLIFVVKSMTAVSITRR